VKLLYAHSVDYEIWMVVLQTLTPDVIVSGNIVFRFEAVCSELYLEAVCSSEIFVFTYKSTCRYYP